ncbi:MAG: alginate export family protein, partial [Deltaproteobacteria bacterium]|nr:alginate export family protein [Deltaproteobacteria bacterium]
MKKIVVFSCISFLLLCGTAFAQGKGQSTPLKILQGEIELLKDTIDSNYKEMKSLKEQLTKLSDNFEKYVVVFEEIKKKEKLISQMEGDLKALQKKFDEEEARQNGEIAGIKSKLITPMFDYRFRPEYKNNLSDFSNKSGDKDFFVPSRLRFGVTLNPSDLVTLVFELQDSRFFGEEKSPTEVNPDTKSLDLHRAYLKLNDLFVKGLSFEAGRMSVVYGGSRMIGNADWSYNGRVFDGARLSYAFDNIIKADALAFIINEGKSWSGHDKRLFGLYLTSPYLQGFDIDLYFLYLQDDEEDNVRDIYTIGVRAKGTPVEGLVVEGEAAIQAGKNTTGGTKQDQFATAYYFSANYTIPVVAHPQIGGFFSSASGDGNPSDKKNHNFY